MRCGTHAGLRTLERCSSLGIAKSEGMIMALLGTKLSRNRHFLASTQRWRNDESLAVLSSGIFPFFFFFNETNQFMSTDRDDHFAESALEHLSQLSCYSALGVLLEAFILGCYLESWRLPPVTSCLITKPEHFWPCLGRYFIGFGGFFHFKAYSFSHLSDQVILHQDIIQLIGLLFKNSSFSFVCYC